MANPPGWNFKKPVEVPKDQFAGQGKTRVNMNTEDFDKLVEQQGVRVKVYRTMLCPNVKSIDGGEHELNCNLCQGNGFVDVDPIETMVYMQTQKLEKVHRAQGYWDGNSVMGTFKNGIELQYFTLVELLDFTDIFFQRIKRQQGNVDVLKYEAICVLSVIDGKGKRYYQETDFTLDSNGSIKWKPNKGPTTGQIYSVSYEHKPLFRATEAIHVNRFVQDSFKSPNVKMTKVPEQWMLQKEFLVKRRDQSGDALDPNLIRDPDSD